MGLLDFLFGDKDIVVQSILPEAAKNEIMQDRLPRLNTDKIFLKRGEYCCYIDKALLLFDKSKKVYKHFGGSGESLLGGARHNWGVGYSTDHLETEQYKAILYITNQRVILQCKEHGFDKPHKQISAIRPYTNAIELQYGSKTYSIAVPDGEIPYRVIQNIQNRRFY